LADPPSDRRANRYQAIIQRVFLAHYRPGMTEVPFDRTEFEAAARKLKVRLPRNLGDIIYSFRYRTPLPESILSTAAPGMTWIIRPAGRGRSRFVQIRPCPIAPAEGLSETKVPDATPGIIDMYAFRDEQALLAKLRYNRLVDIFTGVTCYSLQSHLRTTVPDLGQVETDELYIGVDRRGVHYVFPVQAKGATETLGLVQIEQDTALCRDRFPELVVRPLGAQFIEKNLIALFEFEDTDQGIRIAGEKHYRLVPPEQLTTEELRAYRNRPD
jgi:hypothetical protein